MSADLDRIVTGNILTMADESPVVEAVGINDGIIVALGTAEEIKSMAAGNTDIQMHSINRPSTRGRR